MNVVFPILLLHWQNKSPLCLFSLMALLSCAMNSVPDHVPHVPYWQEQGWSNWVFQLDQINENALWRRRMLEGEETFAGLRWCCCVWFLWNVWCFVDLFEENEVFGHARAFVMTPTPLDNKQIDVKQSFYHCCNRFLSTTFCLFFKTDVEKF